MAALGGISGDLALAGERQVRGEAEIPLNNRFLPGRDQGPEVAVGGGGACGQGAVVGGHVGDDLVITRALDKDARRGRAGLARVLQTCVDQKRQGAVKVGIGKYQLRAFAAKLQRDRDHIARSGGLHQLPGGQRAGKAEVLHARVGA
ncbi:hypothetical protein GALL_464980 [mine drainage metagenome]|uniref:Uncharacterized protein n=1 Tax=mine drainage metagenome TaxID=410659 RepID=A0A1J5PVR3_9ZZZZ